jgi:hypothetical protein
MPRQCVSRRVNNGEFKLGGPLQAQKYYLPNLGSLG